jgi:2-polyprenyl-3-methyl-5-hydroxy-6-metoxy-1,4-benzoquinol methylase
MYFCVNKKEVMKDQWNKRFSEREFIYGKEPNEFLKEELSKLPAGKILFLGEGEGRNSVYAATLGWSVDAVDYSESGKQKALSLSEENNVVVNYAVSDIFEYEIIEDSYDAVVLIYLHVSDEMKPALHEKAVKALKKSGRIILEAFEKEQIKYGSGGPKDVDFLYGLQSIAEDFIDLDFEKFSKEIIALNEGGWHKGEAAVIRFVGIKN